MAQKAIEEKKPRRTFEDVFYPKERQEYVTRVEGEEVVSKSPTAAMKYNPKTKQATVENAMIGVDAVETPKPSVKQEIVKAMAPEVVAPKVENPPTSTGPYAPMDSQYRPQAAAPKGDYTPQKDDSFPWDRALIGATPLLVGMLTGNGLEGAQASSKYLVDSESDLYKRERDFDGKLNEMRAKRDMASSDGKSNYNKAEVFNPSTGKTEIWSTLNGSRHQFLGLKSPLAEKAGAAPKWFKTTVFDEASQKYVEKLVQPDTSREFVAGQAQDKFKPDYDFVEVANGSTKDPYDAQKDIYKNGEFQRTAGDVALKPITQAEGGKKERQLSAQQFQALNNYTKPTGEAGKQKQKMESIISAVSMLNEGGPIGESGLPSLIARGIFGETGVLTEQDVKRVGGDLSLVSLSRKLFGKVMDGEPLQDNDRKDIYQVLQVAHRIRAIKMGQERDAYVKAYKGLGVDIEGPVRDYTIIAPLPDLTGGVSPTRIQEKNKAAANLPQIGEIRKGFKYKGGDPSDQYNWEKVK